MEMRTVFKPTPVQEAKHLKQSHARSTDVDLRYPLATIIPEP